MKPLPHQDSIDPATKRICVGCVGEPYLKSRLEAEGTEGACSYCEEESKTFTIKQIADRIERAFEDHYERTPTGPGDVEAAMLRESGREGSWQRSGEHVIWAIADAADIKESAAKDVHSVLESRHSDHECAQAGIECLFATDSYYTRKTPGCHEFMETWNDFEHGLKTEARFFSRYAQARLEELFADLQNLKTDSGTTVIVTGGPESKIRFLHRARVFAAADKELEDALKHPWKHLGPPPAHAASAGRMNARGISVFYGATEPQTALAEVRPPVGSKVAVARFAIKRPLRLLDVAALKSVVISGSIFDPTHLRQVQRAIFMEILSNRISRPVMPNEEALEYLPTQAVADYLATEANLDGIIFPSVQVGQASSNVVLFHHASRVEEVELPKEMQLDVSMEQHDSDGVSPDYIVWEVIPSAQAAPKLPEPDPLDFIPTWEDPRSFDGRSPTLHIDIESVSVHHITAVQFTSTPYPVRRHRLVEPEGQQHF